MILPIITFMNISKYSTDPAISDALNTFNKRKKCVLKIRHKKVSNFFDC